MQYELFRDGNVIGKGEIEDITIENVKEIFRQKFEEGKVKRVSNWTYDLRKPYRGL